MKLKHAIIEAMKRDQLKAALLDLGLDEGIDLRSVSEMASRISRSPKARPDILLDYLDERQVKAVCELINVSSVGRRRDLIERLLTEEDYRPTDRVSRSGRQVAAPKTTQSTTPGLVNGALVYWAASGLTGVVQALEGNSVSIRFDNGDMKIFSLDSGVLQRVALSPGAQVARVGDPRSVGVVLEEVSGQAYPTWRVSFPGSFASVAEMGLRPAQVNDPLERMRSLQLGSADDFNLRAVAADYWTAHQHNELVSLANARVDLKPHQVFVVHKVIKNYPHRFLLCDEVGLGKTIEAAMVIKELRARGQAKRVLVIVPSGLMRQWQFELKTKFNEAFAIYDAGTVKYLKGKGISNPWTDHDSIITSHTWASWTPERRAEIASVDWDMVVVDEAHHARLHRYGRTEKRTNLYRLVSDLVAQPEFTRRAALFLTATPLQLARHELYSLIDMLDPILFSSEKDFVQHVESLSGLNQLVELLKERGVPKDLERFSVVSDVARFLDLAEPEARELLEQEDVTRITQRLQDVHRLSEVLIRNRKGVVGGFQPRSAYRWEVRLSEHELKVHKLMDSVFEEGFKIAQATNQNAIGFLMVILQKLLASSSRALLTSLQKRRNRLMGGDSGGVEVVMAQEELDEDEEASAVVERLAPGIEREIARFDDVIALLEEIDTDSKANVLRSQLEVLFEEDPEGKVLIFTEFRETQEMLRELLSAHWNVQKFHGQLSPEQKDASVHAFRTGSGPQILLSTESGGEGRNFQFCHYLVNYDLPWNPMKVEQRIGRIDRIGQEHPITIFNFHVQGTIEGRILEVLEERIRIFEEAVGSLDPILGEAEADIRKALRLASEERDRELERLGQQLQMRIATAREAEEKLHDFILQAKSFRAEIAQVAMQIEAPIKQKDFELFLTRLLVSANAYLHQPQNGERRVVFHAPFTVEHPELFQEGEARRVCFDPRLFVDSDYVEYFGFGHPIVDVLVRRVLEEQHDGAAAVRRFDPFDSGIELAGWQFNWLIKVGGLRPKEFLYPVFVGDDGTISDDVGDHLSRLSRGFHHETTSTEPDTENIDRFFVLAEERAGLKRDQELNEARRLSEERAAIEEGRVLALYEHRMTAAGDRIDSCRATLEKLQRATERQIRAAIPLWEANLIRAEAELGSIRDDREKALMEINRQRTPGAEFVLLNVARIEV